MTATPVRILLVEDNPADIRLLREAMKSAKLLCDISVVYDGEAALDFVFQRGEHASAPRPDLILLDLNLPKRNGIEVLSVVKSDARTAALPVVVLTTSDNDEDVVRSYTLHANCYIRKPPTLDDFVRVVHSIDDFWFSVVRLPARP